MLNYLENNLSLTLNEQDELFNTDRGIRYVSKAYFAATPAGKFIRSYSQKANPWDNAVIESNKKRMA